MVTNKRSILLPILAALLCAGPAAAKSCPKEVKSVLEKEMPRVRLMMCGPRATADGRTQYVAAMDAAPEDVYAEIYLDAQGKLLLMERRVDVATLPDMVFAAFNTLYPNTSIDGADKVVDDGGRVRFDLAFDRKGSAREAEFTPDGRFVTELAAVD